MKKSSFSAMLIIILVAVIIYLVCTGAKAIIVIPAIIFTIIACALLTRLGKCEKVFVVVEEEPKQQKQQTLQDLIDTYGTPDDIIVTDATRGNETDGVVLAYDKGGSDGKGFFVCNGKVLDKSSITNITFNNNFGTAFGLPDEFQIVVTTNEENLPKCFIRAGNDIDTAKDIIKQMKAHL